MNDRPAAHRCRDDARVAAEARVSTKNRTVTQAELCVEMICMASTLETLPGDGTVAFDTADDFRRVVRRLETIDELTPAKTT